MRKPVLVGEAFGRDCFEPRKKALSPLLAFESCGERMISKLVVVTVVAKGSGPFREFSKLILILLVEKRVLRCESLCNWWNFLILCEGGNCESNEENQNLLNAHRPV